MSDPYNKVVIQGTMPGGDTWSIGPVFGGNFSAPIADFEDLATWGENIVHLYTNAIWPTSVADIASSAVKLTGVRTEYYDSTNKLAQVAETPPAQATGGVGSLLMPNQCALVVSLQSGRPGRSYNGRMYLPCLSGSLVQATGHVQASATADIATDVAQWLADIANAAPGATKPLPAIFSQKLGITSSLSSVRVGDVVDTQRRRRDKMLEAYSSAPIPAS